MPARAEDGQGTLVRQTPATEAGHQLPGDHELPTHLHPSFRALFPATLGCQGRKHPRRKGTSASVSSGGAGAAGAVGRGAGVLLS